VTDPTMVTQPQPAPQLQRVLATTEDLRALKAACGANPSLQDLWDIIAIITTTGVGRRELIALRWSDVDIPRRTLTISGPKTGSDRLVPFGREVALLLRMRRNRDNQSEFVLGAAPRQMINRSLSQLAALSMRVCGRRLTMQDLRNSFRQRWFAARGSSDAFALITGRAIFISKTLLCGIQHLFFSAAKFQESIEV
jgi:integrase